MPRKGGITQNFKPPVDSTNAQVIEAVNSLKESNAKELGDISNTVRKTHLGHEIYLWDAEVDDVE